MKQLLTFLLCSFAFLSSFAGNNEAIAYNDKIVSEQNKIGEAILAFSGNPNDFSLSGIKTQAERSLSVLKEMKPYEGDKKFLSAAKALFKFYGDITENEYKKILQLVVDKKKYTQEEITQKINKLTESISKREHPLDKAFQEAQIAFAQKYGFSLRKNDLIDKFKEKDGE
jgi:hypothetical protein